MRIKELTKEMYGFWRVKSSPFKIGKKYFVKAFCTNCNETLKNVDKNRLISGASKSCGCVQRQKLPLISSGREAHNSVDIFQRESKKIYQRYKFGAKKRNIHFGLKLEDLQKFIQQPCTYCGENHGNKTITVKGEFEYNGIDRWNNNIGYELSNCLSCCGRCNKMKQDIEDGSKFIEHIRKILKYHSMEIKLSAKKLRKYEKRLDAIKQNSHDTQTQVAAILIDPKTGAVVAEGYNGFIRGANDNILPNTRPEKYPYMIHAEMNVIFNAIRSGVSTDERIVFCTLSPCTSCLRALYQSGVSVVYFKDKYIDFDNNINMLDLNIRVSRVEEFYRIDLEPRK